jgi:CHAT domain-containing protein
VLAVFPAEDRPGASLLHVSSHAWAAASAELSYLLLPYRTRLLVSSVLRQAQGCPADAPGGLVVLASCMSDLTIYDHDEALTLATAFLAAGSAGVIGSRWQVVDQFTAPLMFMFHHYLARGQPPAGALRAAQLWMLDPQRCGPPEMPAMFDDLIRSPALAREFAWAAFAYQGQ